MAEKNQCPVANPTLVLREEFDDWAVLFDPDTGDAFGLNPTSVFIYKQLNGKNSSEDIVKALHERFEDISPTARGEIDKFISQLTEKGYVGFEVRN